MRTETRSRPGDGCFSKIVNRFLGLRIARRKKSLNEAIQKNEHEHDVLKKATGFLNELQEKTMACDKSTETARLGQKIIREIEEALARIQKKKVGLDGVRRELERVIRLVSENEKDQDKMMYLASCATGIPLVKPRSISIDTAARCNLRCRICNQWKDENQLEKLTVTDLKRLIDNMQSWCPDAILEFSGQEPLMNRSLLLESLEYAKGKIKTAVSTNGILLTPENAKALIAAAPSHISVSVDGSKKETHDYIRNMEGAFDKTVQGIKNLVAEKRTNGKSGAETAIAVTFVITNNNIDEIIPVYNFLKSIGVDCISYNPYTVDNSYFFNPDATYNKNEFWVSEGNLPKLRKRIGELLKMKEAGSVPLIINSVDQLSRIPKYFELKNEFNKEVCYAGYNYFHITNFGEVTVCGKGPQLNIRDLGLAEIWDSASFWETRNRTAKCRQPCLNNCFELL